MRGSSASVKTRPTIPRRQVIVASIPRPESGPIWRECHDGLEPSGLPAFQSNGGPSRAHPARSYPFSFEVVLPDVPGKLRRLTLFGIFALYAGPDQEAEGAFGATIQGYKGKDATFRQDLLNGRCYGDAAKLEPIAWLNGDGTSLETIGRIDLDGTESRVDMLTIDVPADADVRHLRFKDLGSPASFVIFDVFLEFEMVAGCPFRERSGGVSLEELGAVVRVGDRVRFSQALDQLFASIDKSEDLDEARGQSLTFLAIVTAATLEMGGPRSMVRVGLEAARELDKLQTKGEIREAIQRILESVAQPLFVSPEGPSARLVDRALALVERNFAKDLTDATVAEHLGLSTSHFRYLFKQATGQPFHRYLVSVRLEKAKRLLLDGEMPISQIAHSVGFTGLSHFSRAFSARFSVSPTSFRRPWSGDAPEGEGA